MRHYRVSAITSVATGAPSDVARGETHPEPTDVFDDWSLKPAGLNVGDSFRLLFLSSTKRDATSTDIAVYNTFVQDRAAAGHADIQAHSAGFRVVGCTSTVDARDNTATTYTASDKGVPIYWLDGDQLADDYEDFYDQTWANQTADKNESGANGPNTAQSGNFPLTGCTHDGTERSIAGDPGGLGNPDVGVARPSHSQSTDGPLGSNFSAQSTNNRPMYGLSAVFRVVEKPDATLSALTLVDANSNAIALTPTFAADTTAYTATVEHDVDTVTLTATKNDADATVAITDDLDPAGSPGTAELDLDVGVNNLVVTVTATDGVTTETYTVVVTRASACGIGIIWCATLTARDLGSGHRGCANSDSTTTNKCTTSSTLSEDAFAHDSTDYAVTSVQVRSNGSLRLFVNPNLTTATQSLALHVGDVIFAFEDANTRGANHRYWNNSGLSWALRDEIELKLTENTDATLSDLDLSWDDGGTDTAITLSPTFDAATTSYTATVTNEVEQITVAPTVNDSDAADPVFLDGNDMPLTDADTNAAGFQVDLDVGSNTIKVKVSAVDVNTTETYTVEVARTALPPEAVLVSNLDETNSAEEQLGVNYIAAQQFTTGASSYVVTAALIDVHGVAAGTPDLDVSICPRGSGNFPDLDNCLGNTLRPPSTIGAGVQEFKVRGSGITLAASTNYFLVVDQEAVIIVNLKTTVSDSEATDYGWSIANAGRQSSNDGSGWGALGISSASLSIAILGYDTTSDPASSDASLSDLDLSWDDGGTEIPIPLSPTFDTATTAYAANVANSVDEFTVTPTRSDDNATWKYLDGSNAELTDADTMAEGFQVAIANDATKTVKVQVTAEDDINTETYTVAVTSAAADACNAAREENLRLVGGDNNREGSLQICHDNQWGHVCDDEWAKVDANVACRQLGFERGAARATIHSEFVSLIQVKYWLDDVACNGSESKLSDCTHRGWGVNNCQFSERAGAVCKANLVNDATLSALEMSWDDSGTATDIPLSPAFDSETTAYTASVANAVGQITIEGTKSDTAASVTYLDDSDTALTDADTGTTGFQVDLDVGANTVKAKVTAGDTTTTETYTVVVSRPSATLVWDTTLTIGVHSVSGIRGFTTQLSPQLGSLDDATFEHPSGTERQVISVYAIGTDGVYFVTDSGGADFTGLVLEWAGETLPLDDATRASSAFLWGQTWLDSNAPSLNTANHAATLPEHGTGAVCLRTASQSCPSTAITEATVVTIKADTETVPLRSRQDDNADGVADGTVSWTLTRAGPTATALTVAVALTQDKTLLPADKLTHDVTFAAGASDTSLVLSPTDFANSSFIPFPDGEVVENGTLTATVSTGDDYILGTDASAAVTMAVPIVMGFEDPSYTIAENGGTLPVKLVARTGVGAPVPFQTVVAVSTEEVLPVEAVLGEDYESLSISVGIESQDYVENAGAWRAEKTIEITIVEDDEDEPDERFTLKLEISPGLDRSVIFVKSDGTRCAGAGENAAGRCDAEITIDLGGDTNNPAAGAPTISGTAQVGETLTAAVDGITDAQGRTKADADDTIYAFTYQWVRVDSLNAETDIDGATDATYTLRRADEGHTIKVRAMFRDDSRNHEARTSGVWPTSGTVLASTCDSLWCGTLTVQDLGGNLLGCRNSTSGGECSDTANLSEDGFNHAATEYSVTTLRLNASAQLQLILNPAIATGSTGLVLHVDADSFAFGDADSQGTNNRNWNSSGLSWTAGDEVALKLTDADTTAATGNPEIMGAPQVGQTLTARKGDIDDADGEPDDFPKTTCSSGCGWTTTASPTPGTSPARPRPATTRQ